MSKEYHLNIPFSEEEAKALEIGDVVYVSGIIHTLRDMAHARVAEMLRNGEPLPFDLASSAIWHAAPVVYQDENGKWHTPSAGSTTSSRYTPLGAEILEKLKMRATIGKGTMKQPAIEVMKKIGSVFLNTTGGTAALYAQKVEEIEAAHWLELGLPETVWVMRVKEFGPLIVGIDSRGASLYDNMREAVNLRLKEQFEKAGISIEKCYTCLPVSIPGESRQFTSK